MGVFCIFEVKKSLANLQITPININTLSQLFGLGFLLLWIVFAFFWTYLAIKQKILLINKIAIFDKRSYKLTLKTQPFFQPVVIENYSFDIIADILVDGDKINLPFIFGFRTSFTAQRGLSCIAIRLTNGDLISLDIWYSSSGFDKKQKIVAQIRPFINSSVT
jgi:hypothetical protein